MKKLRGQIWVALSTATLLVACGGGQRPVAEDAVAPAEGDAVEMAEEEAIASIANPSAQTGVVEGRLPGDLIPTTTVLQRLPQVQTGRANPFSAVATRPTRITAAPPPPVEPTPQQSPIEGTRIPSAPISAQPVAPLPAPQSPAIPAAVPVVAPAPAPAPVPPPSLASQLRISGIVQIGNQYQVLIELPNESFSRSFRVGEMVNGRVRLARIDAAPNREPWVVLVEDGVETIKTVDNSG